MMIVVLLAALAAFGCFVLGVVTGDGGWYLGTIAAATLGLVIWAIDWVKSRRQR